MIKKVLPVLFTLLLAACTSGQATTKITITVKEFAFDPNIITVTAGEPVELTFINEGAVEHDFAVEVIPVTDVSTSGGSDHHISGDHSKYALHTSTPAGETSTLTFTPTEPGTYKIICSVPGHLDAGMTGELIVK